MSVRRWKEMHTAARECVFQIAPITDRCLPSARRTAGRPAGERRERPRWLSCWCAQPNCTRREMIVAVLFSDWHRGRGTSWGIEAADYYVEYHAPSAKKIEQWRLTMGKFSPGAIFHGETQGDFVRWYDLQEVSSERFTHTRTMLFQIVIMVIIFSIFSFLIGIADVVRWENATEKFPLSLFEFIYNKNGCKWTLKNFRVRLISCIFFYIISVKFYITISAAIHHSWVS